MDAYQVIGKSGRILPSPTYLHPGEVLALELKARQIKVKDFALQLSIHPSQLSELLHGKRHIGASLALILERILDIDADYWMRVQAAYDLAIARQKQASLSN